MPPAPGPNAAPRTPAVTQTRAARAPLPVVSARRSRAATTTNAAPTAWTQRAATSSSNDGCKPAGQRRSREDECAGEERSAWPAPREQRSGHGDEREHEVEGRENPGDRRDPDVEASENLGQRERDDRGVREREPDGKTEQPRAHATESMVSGGRRIYRLHADLLAVAERDGDHRAARIDRLARRRLRGVPLASRGRREAGGDGGQDRSVDADEPRDRPRRARVRRRRRVALHGRRRSDRRARPGSDRDPGPLCRLRRLEQSAGDRVPGRSRRALARSANARRRRRVGPRACRDARRRRPRRSDRVADVGDDRGGRRLGARACHAGASSSPSGSSRRSAPGTGCRR